MVIAADDAGEVPVRQRILFDKTVQADVMRRRGPEAAVNERKRVAAEVAAQDMTFLGLCIALAGGAQPYTTPADLQLHQVQVLRAFATGAKAVLVLGVPGTPPYCGGPVCVWSTGHLASCSPCPRTHR